MKFSEQWLREWVNPAIDTDALVAQITMAGLEVDSVEPVAGAFSGVIVAEVVSAEQHPNADKLRVCSVTTGAGEPVQVVCGAPNARAGIKVAFAQVGAVLPGNFKIKKAKLRQVESFGMLCSNAELELSDDHDGIIELAPDAPVGTDLRDYLGLDDQMIEVDLTPNRGDCLGIAGLAREVGVLNKEAVNEVECAAVAATIEDRFPVEVESPDACPRYIGRVIRNVNLSAQSPLWMQERLRRSGVRSIDPVVDVTNYVMLELGQPMHAFDLAQLNGGILVRMANAGEQLTLLDGQELTLNPETLVIADQRRPLALAGIMGGEDSGVSAETRDIFLESAFFSPLAVAGKARSYGLHTDSSHRFERGVDPELQRRATERATALLLEIVGGEPGPVIEVASEAHLPRSAEIILRAERIRKVLALELPAAEVEEILSRLGMTVAAQNNDSWIVSVPSYRFDISLEEDLLEELARIYGYNRLPVCSSTATLALRPKAETRQTLPDLRRALVARGYQEAITYSFVEPRLQQLFDPAREPVALANPISADMAVMRTTLWPGLARAMQHNQHRQQSRVRLFETGMRFIPTDGGLQQDQVLAGVVFGSRHPEGWTGKREAVDYFDVKGDLEALLALGGNRDAYRFVSAEHPALHPGQTAAIEFDGRQVGVLGALHPSHYDALDLNGPVFLFEIALSAVQAGKLPAFAPLSKFPETRRDLALVVDQSIHVDELLSLVREQAGEWLTQLTLFDVYAGEGIENGKKSLALGLTWQHPSHTLTDEEINSVFSAIVNAAQERFSAALRG
ncbi:phenylalanine--tRNA ligase subunit beta [Motiliproteus sediminis]|uniref:phenylalanine--tRNA ligase subunit beta n=1 Tax=Motiliproteus sediminis TaxID=1468178 RepID=UPI001AEFC416|nr:phenylalanine--tRNA ligase subunit beta [Motiliproteus sediminis]